jgi:xylan 1,4-beta-xylosidase
VPIMHQLLSVVCHKAKTEAPFVANEFDSLCRPFLSIPFRALLILVFSVLFGPDFRHTKAQSAEALRAPISETIEVDTHAPAHDFPHFWEKMFGSGRAILTLRESYRNDLRAVKEITDFEYVRFHAIFHDETGIYSEDQRGNPVYNFSYIDQIYDGLLANKVRPCVEISFMPRQPSSNPASSHAFWYKPNVEPPKDWNKWDELVRAFARHLVDRYGENEVAQWYFEVWNEPNIDFWAGTPKQSTYFELYDHTARALKSVSPKLRVGGPATAAADWVDAFLTHVNQAKVPVDFVSTHGYADDTVENLFHTTENIPVDQRVCRAIQKVHTQIAESSRRTLPLLWTEWNVPSFGNAHARDTTYVGAALADDIRQCDGFVDMMSFWTFSDVFEEDGPKKEPFDGGFGLMAMGGIKKASYVAFGLLHNLGAQRLAVPANDMLVTRRKDGTLVIAAWNLVDPGRPGNDKQLHLNFKGVTRNARVAIQFADGMHGDTLAAYRSLGSPRYPTLSQVETINRAAARTVPLYAQLNDDSLDIDLSPNALVLIEVPVSLLE